MKKYLSFSLIFIGLFFVSGHVFSESITGIQKQIENTNAQIQALDREIKQYQDQISETNQQSNTLSNLIKELTLTRSKLLKEKEQTQKKITATGFIIGALDSDIHTKEENINRAKQSISAMLNELYRRDGIVLVERLFSQENIAEASREYNSMVSVNENLRERIGQLNGDIQELDQTKEKKVGEQEALTTLKNNLTEKQMAIEVAKKEKDTLLSQTKNQEAAYKKLLAERQKKRDEFEKALEKYEADLQFILNPKSLPKEGSSALSWPLDNVFVTQLFGKTVAAKRLYVSGSHSGVDFRASVGTPVKAMGSGTVMGTGDTDIFCKGASFGKWVFIKYDNGLSSTFGHLSVISSAAGQKVKAGDTVALSGNTGHSTGPHLHVAIYASDGAKVDTVPSLSCSGKNFIMPIAAKTSYLDPMLYLPKITSTQLKNDTPRD
ncbi:MAG: peptidoglycan DD-metalloendopeptidase family protein [Patescibacteria group bacterium]